MEHNTIRSTRVVCFVNQQKEQDFDRIINEELHPHRHSYLNYC